MVHIYLERDFESRAFVAGPLEVYSKAPFYNAYKIQTSMPESRLFSWSESPPNGSQPVLEFITSPNNPDGTLRSQSVPGRFASGIEILPTYENEAILTRHHHC